MWEIVDREVDDDSPTSNSKGRGPLGRAVHSRDDVVSVGNVWGDAQDGDDGVRAISNGEPKLTS